MSLQTMRFCRSRNGGRRCTRELGHAGLHRHRAILWTDAGADPPTCAGSREPGTPAPVLPSGFPQGRALCAVCLGFVALDESGRRAVHETAMTDDAERSEWFNTFGWEG